MSRKASRQTMLRRRRRGAAAEGGYLPPSYISRSISGNPDALPTSITSNGNTVEATAFYMGDGSGSLTPVVGDAVTTSGTGTAPSNTLNHPFLVDRATKFNSGSGYKSAAGNSISTERFLVHELILDVQDNSTLQYVVGNFVSGVGSKQTYINSSRIYFRINDGVGTRDVNAAISLGFQHIIFIMDRTLQTSASYVDGYF
jgi:hypothetical protein